MNPNLEIQPPQHTGGYTLAEVASALGIQVRTVRAYIRKGWIAAKPVKWRKRSNKSGMTAYEWIIAPAEYRRILRDGIRPPADTFDAIERARAHKVEVA